MTPGNVVCTATVYELDDRGVGVQVQVGSACFFSAYRPDRLWASCNLLSNGYWEKGLIGRGVNLSTHLQQVPKSRIRGSTRPLPIRLHDVAFN
jgi:hypothetical protein